MRDHRTRRVQHDGVAHRSLGAAEHLTHRGCVGRRVTACQLADVRTREAEGRGVERQPLDGARLHAPDDARRRGGQLVEPVVTVYHQHARTAGGEHACHHLCEISPRTTDQPSPRPGRIRKRPKQIEDGRHPNLATNHRGVPKGRVKLRGEREPDPDLGDAARDLVGTEIEPDTERL